ncbi:MAG: TonB-dependent receptor [Nitrospira sp.]|nr:MAG: TonB-dependent receptor [Nitrospira sp.]
MKLRSPLRTRQQPGLTLAVSRIPSALLGSVILIIALAACIGPVKPVPTQQSQEAPPPPTETAEAPKPIELAPSEAPPAVPNAPALPLPPLSLGQSTAPQEKEEMPMVEAKPVLVAASRESYMAPNATSGTKTTTPIMDTPLNVQVISQQVLKDQQVIRLEEALTNVSGVTTNRLDGQGGAQSIFLRGFETNTYFRNGIRFDDNVFGDPQQFANVEQIEVLKGPAAILYGRVEPGGMVNIRAKQPLATPYYSLNQQFGSYNLYRTSIDATGPLTNDETLLYRVNMSYQSNGSFRDLVTGHDVFFAPIVKWNISPRTQATLEFEYQRQLSSQDAQGLPLVNNQFISIPPRRNLGEANRLRTEKMFVGGNWSHQFNDGWSITQQVAFKRQHVNYGTFVFPSDIFGNQVDRFAIGGGRVTDTVTTNVNLTGHVNTWGLAHTLLFGGDYYHVNELNQLALVTDPSLIGVDLNNPIHGGPIPLTGPDLQFPTQSNTYGLYLQDQITLPYNVHILGGLRYDYVRATSGAGSPSPIIQNTPEANDAVTPRFGLLWRPQPWLSLYSNYVENFGANAGGLAFAGFDPSGAPLPGTPLKPTSAQQWEVGAKTEFFDGRLRATLAYYNLTKQNVATTSPNPAVALLGFSVATGEVRSKGPELDIQGELLPGWNVIATYANQDVRITKSNNGDVGNRLQFVPRNVGSVWTTYEVQQGPLNGFKVGGGVRVQDDTVNAANTLKSPGYALVGLMTGYSYYVGTSKVTAQLNVHNLLDKNYFTNADTVGGTFAVGSFATPRTFIGSIRIEY